MRTIDDINEDLIELWGSRFQTDLNLCDPKQYRLYSPMQYKLPKPGSLVFVGMNPSFSETGYKTILKGTKHNDLNFHRFYDWPKSDTFDINISHEIEESSLKTYKFFQQHRLLSKNLNTEWEHLDLFAFRETNQENFKKLILKNPARYELNDFGMSQFSLFYEILCMSKPSAIIVANAFASYIYQEQRKLIFNDSLGFHQENLCGGMQTPIFFSGMLTGGRALDTFSRERLFWQIKKVINA